MTRSAGLTYPSLPFGTALKFDIIIHVHKRVSVRVYVDALDVELGIARAHLFKLMFTIPDKQEIIIQIRHSAL